MLRDSGQKLINRIVENQNNPPRIDIGITHTTIDAGLINQIFSCLKIGEDFGLKNDDGGYVFFIARELMITYNPNDSSHNSCTKINSESFANALKLALLGHRELINPSALLFNRVYLQIKEGLAPKEEVAKIIYLAYPI